MIFVKNILYIIYLLPVFVLMIKYGLGDSICLTVMEVCEEIDTKPVCCLEGVIVACCYKQQEL